MRLIELLEIINENTYVSIREKEGRGIAIYDGKNSIPTELNNETVFQVYTNKLGIVIEIN